VPNFDPQHAQACMERIRALLAKAKPAGRKTNGTEGRQWVAIERRPGEDDDE
jgi:hypothetical protein